MDHMHLRYSQGSLFKSIDLTISYGLLHKYCGGLRQRSSTLKCCFQWEHHFTNSPFKKIVKPSTSKPNLTLQLFKIKSVSYQTFPFVILPKKKQLFIELMI